MRAVAAPTAPSGGSTRATSTRSSGSRAAARAAARPRAGRDRARRAAARRLGRRPAPGEGEPARLVATARLLRRRRSSARAPAGCDRALVLARTARRRRRARLRRPRAGRRGRPRLVPRRAGCARPRAIACVFDGAPVLALLGAPGELAREPWFARDAMRTAAAWAGMADAAADAALADLAARPELDDLRALAAGRIADRAGDDRPLARARRRARRRGPGGRPRATAVQLRAAIADAGAHDPRRGGARVRLAPVRHRHGARPRAPRLRAVRAPAPARPDASPAPAAAALRGGAVSVDRRPTSSALLRARPRPVGLRDQPVRAREVRRDDRRAGRPPLRAAASSSAARSACSPRGSPPRCDELLAVDVAEPPLAAGARAARRVAARARRAPRAPRGVPGRAVRPDRRLARSSTTSTPPAFDATLDASGALSPAARCSPSTGARRRATYPLRGDEVHDAPRGALRPRRRYARAPRPRTPSTASSGA